MLAEEKCQQAISLSLTYEYVPLSSSVGVEADAEKMAMVVKELKGKNLEEVMAAGTKKLGSMPSGNKENSVSAYDCKLKVMSVLQTSL